MNLRLAAVPLLALGLSGSAVRAEVQRGLHTEYKNKYIPYEQQSGWGYRQETPAATHRTAAKPATAQTAAAPAPAVEKPAAPEAKAVPESNWVLSGVQFESGSDRIKPSSKASLDEAAGILKAHERVVVEVQGHTDNVGGTALNQTLSEKRAAAVKSYLIQEGVPANRLQARGYGETSPVANNATDSGRAQNRRIAFKVLTR